ncbi:MAG: hypothetical protein FJX59_16435 [Alphaproteobacteria bacterium]|nr:hypothetical protein [Alphaproteobacteria bacterium]
MKTIAATLLAATMAFAEEPPAKPDQAEIPFAGMDGIRDWREDGNRALYVEGRNRQWYRAELFAPCHGLNFAHSIGFVVEPSDTFDRFSAVVVDGQICRLKSLVKSEKPAGKKKD